MPISKVNEWAQDIVRKDHAQKMEEQEIDGEALLKTTKEVLKDCGILGQIGNLFLATHPSRY